MGIRRLLIPYAIGLNCDDLRWKATTSPNQSLPSVAVLMAKWKGVIRDLRGSTGASKAMARDRVPRRFSQIPPTLLQNSSLPPDMKGM